MDGCKGLLRCGPVGRAKERGCRDATIEGRLSERARASGEISDARLDDLPRLDHAYDPPTESDSLDFLAVKTARTSEAVVVATLKALGTMGQGKACSD